MGDYHDLYLYIDTLLLSSIFKNFKELCMSNYSLDTVHYYATPGLSWDVLLKYIHSRVELITDPEMMEMIKSRTRGRIVKAVHRRVVANIHYLPNYNRTLPSLYIIYYNAVNLYGWAMMQPMSVGGHRWVLNVSDWDANRIHNHIKHDSHGYILEVDIDYPKHQHNLHNELPFMPELLTNL